MKHSKVTKKITSQDAKSGFTIIEFTLATAFIAVLLITVSIITSNIISVYQKGLTLKAVNSVGRGLVDEFTTSINAAPSVDTTSLCSSHITNAEFQKTCKDEKANLFVFQQRLGTRTAPGNEEDADGKDTHDVQLGGVFCTGKYSYIWNTYYAFEKAKNSSSDANFHLLSLKYVVKDGDDTEAKVLENFRLARFEDPTYRLCSVNVTSDYKSLFSEDKIDELKSEIDITALSNGRVNVIKTPEQGFLNSFDLDLQLYELTMFPIAQDNITLRTFMSGTFILATERGNINLTRAGNYCDVAGFAGGDDASNMFDLGAEYNYCAINKFNFAARTAGM